MNLKELQKKILETAELTGDDSSLPSLDSPSASSAASAELDAASSSSFAVPLAQSLAGMYQSELPFGCKALCSFDGGLEISVFGSWLPLASGSPLVSSLSALKQSCVENNATAPVVLGRYSFWLQPKAARFGFGSYSYILLLEEDGRCKYRFYLHRSPSAAIPAVRVKAEYQAFRFQSLKDVENEISDILSFMGLEVERFTLSRIDFNVTLNQDMTSINKAFDESRLSNRCQDYVMRGGRHSFTSLRIGNINNIQLAIYDKQKELFQHYDADKLNDLQSIIDSVSTPLIRYEFRLGRNFLRQVEVDTISDFIQNQLLIVNYLTLFWFHVRKRLYQYGRTADVELDSQWKFVRLALLFWTVSGCNCISKSVVDSYIANSAINKHYRTLSDITPLKRKYYHTLVKPVKRLFKIAVGCLVSAVVCGSSSSDYYDSSQLKSIIERNISILQDEIYDSYKDRFRFIEGAVRNENFSLIESSSFFGGASC